MLGPWLPRTPDAPARREVAGERGWVVTLRLDGSAEIWDPDAGQWQQCANQTEADRLAALYYPQEPR